MTIMNELARFPHAIPLEFSSPVKMSCNPKGRRTGLGFSLWPHFWNLMLGGGEEAGEDQHR